MILAVVKKNAIKTETSLQIFQEEQLILKTNAVRCFIGAMSKTKTKYLVEMVEFRPVDNL
jgi:hypothetical protein